jgi:hypothetical protein
MKKEDKLELKATLEVEDRLDNYKIIDFLNKNLKEKDVIFGLSKNKDKMIISIYET